MGASTGSSVPAAEGASGGPAAEDALSAPMAEEAVEQGARVFKAHVQVGGVRPGG